MTVREIMTQNFEMVESSATLTQAAQKMKDLDVGVLPIKEGTKLIGLVTDRDIVVRALAAGRNPESTQVKDIISSEIVYCREDNSVEEVAGIMEDRQIRRLIVCDSEQKPTGIVSLGDIAARTKQEQLAGEALEAVSEPARPSR